MKIFPGSWVSDPSGANHPAQAGDLQYGWNRHAIGAAADRFNPISAALQAGPSQPPRRAAKPCPSTPSLPAGACKMGHIGKQMRHAFCQ